MLYYMIMAGGIGSRMNSPELPKQYLKVNDEPIIVRTIRNFEEFGSFTAGVVCCPIDWIEYTKAMLLEYGITSNSITVISGGKNRNCSVKNGCRFLSEISLVHGVVLWYNIGHEIYGWEKRDE